MIRGARHVGSVRDARVHDKASVVTMRSQAPNSRFLRPEQPPSGAGGRGSIRLAMGPSPQSQASLPPADTIGSPRGSRRAFLKRTAVLLAGSISAPGLAACTLDVPSAPTPTAAPSTQVSVNDVVVGAVLSLSGRFSREGTLMKAGYQTWLDAVQRAGGVRVGRGQRPVRLLFSDDESEPLTAGQRVERLAADPGVHLLLGPYSSQLTGAVVTVVEKQGRIVVLQGGWGPGLIRRGYKVCVAVKQHDYSMLHCQADLAATVMTRAQP